MFETSLFLFSTGLLLNAVHPLADTYLFELLMLLVRGVDNL